MNKQQLQAIENKELRLHKIRTKLITFKELAIRFMQNPDDMTQEQWYELDLAARVSDDVNDSLYLNKLTTIFPSKYLN